MNDNPFFLCAVAVQLGFDRAIKLAEQQAIARTLPGSKRIGKRGAGVPGTLAAAAVFLSLGAVVVGWA